MFESVKNHFNAFRPFRYYSDAVRVYRTALGIDSRPADWNPNAHMTLEEANAVMREKFSLDLRPAWVLSMKKRANEHALSSQTLSMSETQALESGLASIEMASRLSRKRRIGLLDIPPFN